MLFFVFFKLLQCNSTEPEVTALSLTHKTCAPIYDYCHIALQVIYL